MITVYLGSKVQAVTSPSASARPRPAPAPRPRRCSPTGQCPCPCDPATQPTCGCRNLATKLSVGVTKGPVYATYPLTYLKKFNGNPSEVGSRL